MRRCAPLKNSWTLQEAGMAQLDDVVGSVMQYVKDNGMDDNTILVFHHRQWCREFHLSLMVVRLHLQAVKEPLLKAVLEYLRLFVGLERFRR